MFLLITVVTIFTFLSATAHAQDAEIKVIRGASESGRLTLSVNGTSGWWWPRTAGLRMLADIDSGRECKVTLVPRLESRIKVRDWQFVKLREVESATETLIFSQAQLVESTLDDNRELRLDLAKQQRRMGMGALIGAGSVTVVVAVILGLVAAL
jgi:hypothetical protein